MTQTNITDYGWKNMETGTICQTVTAPTPRELFNAAGLPAAADPSKPYKGFLAVPVKKTVTVTKKGRKKIETMKVEELS